METVKKVIEKVLPTSTTTAPTLTKQTGCPVAVGDRSLTAGPHGPIVFSDVQLIEKLTQFDREKTPPRNVHALGTGCYGTFTVTNDITKYSKASIFSQVGKKTDLFTRLSGIFLEQGEADTMRDPRGFALKFYTDEGNWDLMGINTPVFNVRDAKLGPDAVHAFKRDPRTGMWNPTQVWDFVANHPESLHQTLMIYTDKGGTPASYRYMTAYGCHTFALINKENIRHWVKFHIISEQGTKGLTQKEAKLIAGEDPNFLSRDLWQAIEREDFPKWRLCIQVMNDEEGYKNPIAFDPTKTWSHKDYPLIEVGIIELNRNPTDFHSEVEQVAFSSANVVPGIGLSPDRLLQGRLLIYDDTQHHRLGANFKQLPVNRPRIETNTMLVGGPMNFEVKNKFPHYLGNSFGGPKPDPKYIDPPMRADGPVDFYAYPGEGTDDDYYAQPGDFVRLLIPKDRLSLVENIATSLEKVLSEEVVRKTLHHLHKIDTQFGNEVETLLRQRKEGVVKKTEAEKVVETMTKLLNTHTATSE